MASASKTITDYFSKKRKAGDHLDNAGQATCPNIEKVSVRDVGQKGDNSLAAAQAFCKEIQSKLASRALCLRGNPWVKPLFPDHQIQGQQTSSASCSANFQHSIYVWSPEHLLPGFQMACPACRTAAASMEWVRPRILHGLTHISYYLTCKYSCMSCGTSKSTAAGSRHKPRKTFMADAPEVLAGLPADLAAKHNLIDSGKIICEPTVLDFIRALATKMSWSGIAEALNELKARSLQECLLAQVGVFCSDKQPDDWDNFKIPPAYRLHDGWVRNSYVKDGCRRQEGRAAELGAEKGDHVLMLDWTRDAAKRSGGSWLFNAMDSKRRILAFKLTATAKPREVTDILRALAERGVKPQVVYVDEECCGAWPEIVGQIWPECCVRLDPAHAMRRLLETVTSTQHPWHGEFCGRLSNAIYTCDAETVDKLEAARLRQMLSSHIPRQELLKYVPRKIENPQKIVAGVSELLADFKSRCHGVAGPLLTTQTEHAWSCLQRHLLHGCLCDPPGVNLKQASGKQTVVGGEAFPIWQSKRGSSALEGFHTHQKQWLGMFATHGQEAGTLLLEDGVARWNRKRRREDANALDVGEK